MVRTHAEACTKEGWEACYDRDNAWRLWDHLKSLVDYAKEAWDLCGGPLPPPKDD